MKNKWNLTLAFFLCFLMSNFTSEQQQVEKAETLYKNGTIYTVDADFSTAQAVAVAKGKILFVGGNAEAEKWRSPDTKVVDLKGKVMVPGLIDSHYHFMGVGRREYHLNLDGTKSLAEFLARIEKEIARKKKGDWITGRGWIEEDWPTKKFPTRTDLDAISPDNPVFLRRADGHAAVANSMAIEQAGITKDTVNPQGGEIIHDAYSGEPTGMFLDKAMGLISRHIPQQSSQEMNARYAKKADALALAYGLTQIHDMGSSWKTVALWKKMYEEDELKIRIHAYIAGPGGQADRLLAEGAKMALPGEKLTVRGIKIVQDGALGSRGAALLTKYNDFKTSGFLIHKDAEIYPTIKTAVKNGIQMAIHAIGDRANRNVIDLYEKALQEVPENERKIKQPRLRIEHAQIVDRDDIPRFKALGVLPSMQASHAIGDLHFAIRRLGTTRIKGGYAWRTFIDQGSMIAMGSDAPVEEGNPMIEFFAAVARKDTTGYSNPDWNNGLKMTREEALKSMTIWASYAVFEEDIKGSIEPGKVADFVVLDRDIMKADEKKLFNTKVLMTIIGDEVVYEKDTQ